MATGLSSGSVRPPITCLVTIHGIGFQQVPTKTDAGYNFDGYADPLHRALTDILKADLSGDPGRGGGNGAIYVRSRSLANGQVTAEEGLRRLGHWEGGRIVAAADEVLRTGEQPFAHVALVYWPIEDDKPQPGSLLEGIVRSAISLQHYTSLTGLLQTGIADVGALITGNLGKTATQSPSLTARSLVSPQARPAADVPAAATPHGVFAEVTDTINALQNDWAAYVCRNDLRERVRGFVRDALIRLVSRQDVGAVVVNAHSQGTVVAFDVLSDLAADDMENVSYFLTSGSPLRKYVDLYSWGDDAGSLRGIEWTNFYDPKDPVADPLSSANWRPGNDPGQAPSSPTLFQCWPDDQAASVDRAVTDVPVDNVTNTTSTGLRAHNYWDNNQQVVPVIAKTLQRVAAKIQVAAPVTG